MSKHLKQILSASALLGLMVAAGTASAQTIGTLTVNLTGAAGQWSINNGIDWSDSGVTTETLNGSYVLKFKGVSGSVAPKTDVVTVAGGDVVKDYAYTPAVARNNWKSWGSFSVTSGTTSHIAADASNNLYLGGYGHLTGATGVETANGQWNAAVLVFAPNGKTAPAVGDQKLITPHVRAQENWLNADGANQGTNGYLGLSQDPLTGKVFLGMDGNPGSPCFTTLMDATGTTDSAWLGGVGFDYTNKVTTGSTPRYQGNAVDADGTLYLGELFINTNKNIRFVKRDGTMGLIKVAGMADHIRDMAAVKGTNGAVTLYALANAYKSVYRLDVNMNDLASTYTAVNLTGTLATAGSGGIYYNAEDNTIVHCNGSTSQIFVYDADSGALKQTLASMTSQNDAVVINQGADNQTMYSVASNKVMFASKREGLVVVTIPGAPTGAKYSVNGGTTWNDSDTTASTFAGENITVTFKNVAGYVSPASMSVVPPMSGTALLTAGSYEQIKADVGVTIEPAGVVSTAGWMLVAGAPNPAGVVAWNASGTTETAVVYGKYSVVYKDVTGYTKPADTLVDITSTAPISLVGTYTVSKGSLLVNTVGPTSAVWSIDDFATTHTSGTALPVDIGSYTVKFSTEAGWDTPAAQTVTVAANKVTAVTGTYTQQTGAISVSIEPAQAASEGGAWSLDSGATWNASGATVSNLALGAHTVIFKNLTAQRWSTPDPATVTVTKGATATATGTYARYTGMVEYFNF